MSIIGIYVDDLVVAGKSLEQIEQVKTTLSQKFRVKDLGELHHFLTFVPFLCSLTLFVFIFELFTHPL